MRAVLQIPNDCESRAVVRAYLEWAVAEVLRCTTSATAVPERLSVAPCSGEVLQGG